jgi:hypothetical protein
VFEHFRRYVISFKIRAEGAFEDLAVAGVFHYVPEIAAKQIRDEFFTCVRLLGLDFCGCCRLSAVPAFRNGARCRG